MTRFGPLESRGSPKRNVRYARRRWLREKRVMRNGKPRASKLIRDFYYHLWRYAAAKESP